MDLAAALDDPQLFAPHFAGASWAAWRTIVRALEAAPPEPGDLDRFRELTGRETWPKVRPRELWVAAGRRGGKTRIAAALAVHRAAFLDYSAHLAAGERATCALIATDRQQARVAMRYVRGFLREIPLLAGTIERETAESIDLVNGATIEVHTASLRSTRGYTLACVICDEISFWRDELSANPADEILAALRPGLATIPGAPLIAVSSPYAKSGPLWETFRRYYGRDDADVLVVRAPTRALNPNIPQSLIDQALAEDPERAGAEYLALFRADVASFIDREVIAACTVPERYELPPVGGTRYVAFVDPSGGSADSFTLAIAHAAAEGDRQLAVLDAVREVRPPFSPDGVVRDFAELLRAYRVREVTGDRYAGEWPRERFRAYGVDYTPSERVKSDLYREALPLLNAGRVELLDLPRLRAQLAGLERRTARGGRESIDHGPAAGARDDLANSACGALVLAIGKRSLVRVEPLLL